MGWDGCVHVAHRKGAGPQSTLFSGLAVKEWIWAAIEMVKAGRTVTYERVRDRTEKFSQVLRIKEIMN